MTYSVCVGVDGSAAALQALLFALDDAALHGGSVHVVTSWWLSNALPGHLDTEEHVYGRQAREVQEAAVEQALARVEQPPALTREVVYGTAGEALVRHSGDDDRLVVGTEHKGALKRMFDGSVSGFCVRHSRIPVIVVPYVDPTVTPPPRSGPDDA